LKQFADPHTPRGHEPYVWIFERRSKKGKKKAPKNIFTEADFYTFTGKDSGKNYALEKTLAQIESDYSIVYEQSIRNKIPLDQKEHATICAFVAAMLQRTMKQKENIEDYFERLRLMVEDLERAHGAAPDLSLKLAQQKENAHKITILQSLPFLTDTLGKMNLAFLCAGTHSSFISSDAPCILFNPELQWHRVYAPALGQKHVEVYMPLSPEISVMFSWANNVRGYLGIGQDRVHELNRIVFADSYEYFIANSPRLKRRWFRRYPLDPVFIWRMLRNTWRIEYSQWKRKRHVRNG
jgi:hypothetical protein